jgi:hypothetical protein
MQSRPLPRPSGVRCAGTGQAARSPADVGSDLPAADRPLTLVWVKTQQALELGVLLRDGAFVGEQSPSCGFDLHPIDPKL